MAEILVEMASREGQREIAEAFKSIKEPVIDAAVRAENAATQAETAQGNAENFKDAAGTSAIAAAASAQAADTTATALTNFLNTKETLTAPAVDPTLSISGAAADAKVTGDRLNLIGNVDGKFENIITFAGKMLPEGVIKGLSNPLSGTTVEGKAWHINKTTPSDNAYQYTDYTLPTTYRYAVLIVTGHSWTDMYPLISFYDASGNLLAHFGQKNGFDYTNAVVTVPRNAVRAVVNGRLPGEVSVYVVDGFNDKISNRLIPYNYRINEDFFTENPTYTSLRNWPCNYIYNIGANACPLLSDIPKGLDSEATIVKVNPYLNRQSIGFSTYVVATYDRSWIGFDDANKILWQEVSVDVISSEMVSVGYQNLTPTQTVVGKAKHKNGSEATDTNYIYSEFTINSEEVIYISGYHFSGDYPFYMIYAGDTLLSYPAGFGSAKTCHRYKVQLPKNATKIIVNGFVNPSAAKYCYPSIETQDNSILLGMKAKRRYLFIGDSYSAGYSHDGDNAGWSAYCAEYLGLSDGDYARSHNGGARFAGSGNTFFDLLALAKYPFDYFTDIVVCGGYNDNWSTEEQILTGIQNFVALAKKMYPYANIHVGFVAWNKAGNGAGAVSDWSAIHQRLINTVLPAYQRCVEYGASYLNNIEYWLNDSMMTNSDGYHPGEAGNRSIARALANALVTGHAPLPYNNDFRV